jgi:uncharacterized repeat protein (TIGR01451 family)
LQWIVASKMAVHMSGCSHRFCLVQPRKLVRKVFTSMFVAGLRRSFLFLCALSLCVVALADTPGQRLVPISGGSRRTDAIQAVQIPIGARAIPRLHGPDRSTRAANLRAAAVSGVSAASQAAKQRRVTTETIHTTAGAWDALTLADTSAIPPYPNGAAGPTQLLVIAQGRMRTFTKAGVADGVIDLDPSSFFSSTMTPGTPNLNFATYTRVRYDRFTNRWIIAAVDLPCSDALCSGVMANRVMFAVSDAASNGVISGSTVWTFCAFASDPTNPVADLSLGVDVHALYFGANMYSSTGSFLGTKGYVVQKSSVLAPGPMAVTSFDLVSDGTSAGPLTAQGVDNYDAGATEGYFVGVDNLTFSTIMFRRVSNPGSATPSISANIAVTVPTTTFPNRVEHAGNTGGTNGNLDALDDRLSEATIRNGRMWAAHNFRVNTTGVANTAAQSRNAVRWYEFANLTGTPTVAQSGTIYDSAATRAAARQYFLPSIAPNGQGHVVLSATMAGTVGATPVYVGRLAGDTLGTMTGPPSVAATTFGTTTANYNPPGDPGGAGGRRWGEYSRTFVDPIDDMTIWTIQQYNQALNTYAIRVGRLNAPPPSAPVCAAGTFNGPTGNLVVTGVSDNGSGFYDPGANLPAPAPPFSHLTASVSNATVNSVTFNSTSQVTLNITMFATGPQNVTITNPDGQSATTNGCFTALNAAGVNYSLTKSDGGASVAPGGTVAYTLTYANDGDLAGSGVTLTETVPANTTFNAGASSAGWSCSPNNNAGSTCNLAVGSLAAHSSPQNAIFAVTVTNPLPPGVTQVSNTASIADDGTHGVDPTPGNNTASDTTPITGSPHLTLMKSDGGASVAPGGTVAYTLSYANSGNRGASGVVLTETVPSNTAFNAGASTAGWSCTPNNNAGATCTLPVGSLAAGGASQQVTFAVTAVSPMAAGVTQISNTASIADDGTNGIDPSPANTASDTTPIAGSPDLTLTKSDGNASVAPGGTVAYTLTYANGGNIGVSAVAITETVPANTTFNAGASTAGWSCAPNNDAGATCTLAVGTVAAGGGSQTATFAVTVDSALPAGVAQISNSASIADDGTNGTDATPADNSASDTTPLTGTAPDLTLTKSDGGASVSPGGTVAYTLTYANAGNIGASGVGITETVPASTTFNAGASTAGWSCAPNNNAGATCTLAVGTVAAGSGSSTATFAVTVDSALPGAVAQISNSASIADDGANGTDPTPGNNSASDTTPISGAAPDLTLTKSDGGASVSPGGTVAYTLTYANAGNIGASGVVLTEMIPANTTFNAGASTAGWSCTPDNNAGATCTLAIGSVGAGSGNQNAVFAVTVAAALPGGVTQISNSASIADDGANGTDTTPGNNSASDMTPLSGAAPDLTLTKSDGGATAAPGGTITYMLSYTNAGTRGASGVVLTETVPANTTFNAAASTVGWSCAPNDNAGATCTLAIGSVVAGSGNQTATFAVTVDAVLPAGVPQISNSASIADDGTNGTDPSPANNTASDTTPLTGGPDLTLTIADSPSSAATGATVVYTYTYRNAGSRGASGVVLTTTVPANTTFNAAASTAGWSCTPNNNAGAMCTLAIGSVVAGSGNQTATFAVTVDAVLPGGVTQISNSGSIADDGANGADLNPADNSATDTTPILAGALVFATKSVSGTFQGGTNVIYTIALTNSGAGPQADNPGNELTDILPAQLALVSATASSGTAVATIATNTVTWNGAIPTGGTVTITITATIVPATPVGTIVSNQASVSYDSNGDSTNDATTVTDSATSGGASDPTTFTIVPAAAATTVIPTLSDAVLMLLAALLAGVGLLTLQRFA